MFEVSFERSTTNDRSWIRTFEVARRSVLKKLDTSALLIPLPCLLVELYTPWSSFSAPCNLETIGEREREREARERRDRRDGES